MDRISDSGSDDASSNLAGCTSNRVFIASTAMLKFKIN